MDIAKRFHQNPLLKPSDLQPGIEGMEITCFLNPGVFRFDGKTWLLLRVAERPVQKQDRKSTRLNSSHSGESRMPSSA